MLKTFRVLISAAVLSAFAPQAKAALSPISIAILSPLQFPGEDVAITGLRASVFWGRHRNVYGFDLGVIGNVTEQKFGGIQAAGLFNWNRGMTSVVGLQYATAVNINVNQAHVLGLQLALGLNMNKAETRVIGFQVAGLGNVSPFTSVWGAQLGIFNSAREVHGFQIGLVNVADVLHGLQIGVLNIHRQGLFAVCPVINFGF